MEEIVAATGLSESSVKLYFSILKMWPKKAQVHEPAPLEAEAPEDGDWDEAPFYRKPEEPPATQRRPW
jgi:hypothetical protein